MFQNVSVDKYLELNNWAINPTPSHDSPLLNVPSCLILVLYFDLYPRYGRQNTTQTDQRLFQFRTTRPYISTIVQFEPEMRLAPLSGRRTQQLPDICWEKFLYSSLLGSSFNVNLKIQSILEGTCSFDKEIM